MTDLPFDRTLAQICAAAGGVRGDVRHVVADQVDRLAPLSTPADRERLITRSIARLAGLDVLDDYLHDDDVDEVMVNRGTEVWIDRNGALYRVADLPCGAIDVVLERILSPLGKRLDRSNPLVDARLPDGGRLCAVVDPIAVDGTIVSIRRHRPRRIPLTDFGQPDVCALLTDIIGARANILVTGATSSGKTTFLRALIAEADPGDRLVVIEDTCELTFPGRHSVRLEARPPLADAPRAVGLSDLVRTALRLRPDRLVVGEFRGPEVLAVVQALNTGHDGSISTCHANSAIDGLHRVETLVMQAAPSWPLAAIRQQVSRSIDAVVHLQRGADGQRIVAEVAEPIISGDQPVARALFADGRVCGQFERRRA